MFICKTCLKKNYLNEESFFRSFGACEICNIPSSCNDINSFFLERKNILKTGKQ